MPGDGVQGGTSELSSEGLLQGSLTLGETLSLGTAAQSQGLHLSGPQVFVPRVLQPGLSEGRIPLRYPHSVTALDAK